MHEKMVFGLNGYLVQEPSKFRNLEIPISFILYFSPEHTEIPKPEPKPEFSKRFTASSK